MEDQTAEKLRKQQLKIIKKEEANRKKNERREKRRENAQKVGEVFAYIGLGIVYALGAVLEIAANAVD